MNRKAQIPPQLAPIFLIIVLMLFLPTLQETLNSIGCQREKGTISDLQSQLSQCHNQLTAETQKSNNVASGLEQCQNDLNKCQDDIIKCYSSYADLKKECDAKEQPKTEYYFIKVFSNKIILFEWLILYHIHLFTLFLSLGITFTIKLFEVEINIQLLNKKNQRKLVKGIKEYLAQNPYMPVILMIILILLTNLPQLL